MAHQVQVNAGHKGVTLPNGNTYDGQVSVTLSDSEFERITPAAFTSGTLTDLGEVVGTTGDLSGLGDVAISSPQVGDTIVWTGSHWQNAPPAPDIDVGGGGGGAAGGMVENHVLDLHIAKAGAVVTAAGTVDTPPIDSGDLFDKTTNDSLQSINGAALTYPALAVGDDYYLTRSGSDTVWFRKAGLYVVNAMASSFPHIGFALTFSQGNSFHSAQVTAELPATPAPTGMQPSAQLLIEVGAGDVAQGGNTLTGGGSLSWFLWNGDSSDHAIFLELFITRIAEAA